MQVIHAAAIEEVRWDLPGVVLGMGTLDGVHVGHQAILRRVAERASAPGATPAVLTFAQHPLTVVRPEHAPALLTPLPLKLALLERLGMAAAVAIHFTPALAALEAEEFVQRALVDGQVVSSRAIRGLLLQGRVAEAQRLLGRPYCLAGEVEQGDGRGRRLGFATANLPVPDTELVKDGVYAGRVLVRGAFRDAMMNLGRAPTFGGGLHRLEIHIPGWEEPLYGERVVAFFLARLRDEQRFADADALRVQLGRDRESAEAVWRATQALPWPEWSLHS